MFSKNLKRFFPLKKVAPLPKKKVYPSEKVTPSEEVLKGPNILNDMEEPVVTIRRNDLNKFQGQYTGSIVWFNLYHEWFG